MVINDNMKELVFKVIISQNISSGGNETKTPKKTYPEGNWVRKTSSGLGDYLKIDDEVTTC